MVDLTSVWDTVRVGRWQPLVLSLFLTPVVIGIKALRWYLLARKRGSISFQGALLSYLAGLTLATLTPLAVGEAGRGMFVQTEDRAGLTGRVILDKLLDIITVSLFASVGFVLTANPQARVVGIVICIGFLIACSSLVLLLPKLRNLSFWENTGPLSRFHVPAIIDGLIDTPLSLLILNGVLSLLGFTIFYSQAFILMRAFWREAPWSIVPYFPIITLSTILPIGIGGVGIREWTAILLLQRFGVTNSVAFSTFFGHFVIVQLLPSLAGAGVIGFFNHNYQVCE